MPIDLALPGVIWVRHDYTLEFVIQVPTEGCELVGDLSRILLCALTGSCEVDGVEESTLQWRVDFGGRSADDDADSDREDDLNRWRVDDSDDHVYIRQSLPLADLELFSRPGRGPPGSSRRYPLTVVRMTYGDAPRAFRYRDAVSRHLRAIRFRTFAKWALSDAPPAAPFCLYARYGPGCRHVRMLYDEGVMRVGGDGRVGDLTTLLLRHRDWASRVDARCVRWSVLGADESDYIDPATPFVELPRLIIDGRRVFPGWEPSTALRVTVVRDDGSVDDDTLAVMRRRDHSSDAPRASRQRARSAPLNLMHSTLSAAEPAVVPAAAAAAAAARRWHLDLAAMEVDIVHEELTEGGYAGRVGRHAARCGVVGYAYADFDDFPFGVMIHAEGTFSQVDAFARLLKDDAERVGGRLVGGSYFARLVNANHYSRSARCELPALRPAPPGPSTFRGFAVESRPPVDDARRGRARRIDTATDLTTVGDDDADHDDDDKRSGDDGDSYADDIFEAESVEDVAAVAASGAADASSPSSSPE
uniref:Uncharacterized protein n=1 Tax=Bicosoecida sp. CB-2014 TaxID=1486930 RepID=A0A7S1CNP4_9STRA|mmetsp:Transcript_7411/g.26481  ORF Transcript_7411/g.26481 Transcript_7411/m.26481 type:complete len:531 (+) Transcript_7411:325-1917(+)|eukprot:CAMPEP_0203827148 /NCGR_PEP_ID=MMETSP0115-20131106/58248_1 /ASSEMBLY_ACC=CAM_ASM_000227 /TAXON_ID=33651 /ORGANISM="Bicosoecid sp, Strain ms1" /LENGTH=530 /DNA_ID=CAMNT_0050736201 /DNA_START=265 /DNA_END=1857 /DNA_ORIENTATION=+